MSFIFRLKSVGGTTEIIRVFLPLCAYFSTPHLPCTPNRPKARSLTLGNREGLVPGLQMSPITAGGRALSEGESSTLLPRIECLIWEKTELKISLLVICANGTEKGGVREIYSVGQWDRQFLTRRKLCQLVIMKELISTVLNLHQRYLACRMCGEPARERRGRGGGAGCKT